MNLKILGALLRKELLLMKRNPFIPKIILVMPLMVMLVIPLVATLDVRNVSVTVVDNDRSQLSRRMITDIAMAEALNVTAVGSSYAEAIGRVERGEADVIIAIPPRFSRDFGKLEVEANGVNATKGTLGAQYVMKSVAGTLERWREEEGAPVSQEVDVMSVVDRFNPTLDFRNYMIPALMVVLLIIICGFLPTLNLVNEKETGTIEAMNVTPVGKFTFVLSKLIPFWGAGLLVVTVGMLVGWLVYGLAPVGNVGAIYLAAVLFSLLMSGLGVTIANGSATILQSIFVMFAVIMVFQLMGGLFTPISSMPEWAQWITYVVPPRYFNEIMRAVYLKGASVAELWQQYLALMLFALFLSILAALTYRKRA